MSKKLSRNAPCPCGSGKKYKQCCIDRDFDWIVMDDGSIARSVPVSEEMKDIISRVPESGPIFQNAPPLEVIEHYLVESMKQAGVHSALIYAFEKTQGLLLNPQNVRKVPQKDVDQWNAAIDEYERRAGVKAPQRLLSDENMDGMMRYRPRNW